MAGRVLRSSDYQRMPWKNGGGTTTEIWKAASPRGEMQWRLSIADVASDGPFSEFPGIDRWIMVIEGKGMALDIAGMGKRRLDRTFEPLFFAGDAKTDCALIDGPIRDFNLMVARGLCAGGLQVTTLSSGTSVPLEGSIAAIHTLRGAINLEDGSVRAGDTWIADQPHPVKATANGETMLAVITINAVKSA